MKYERTQVILLTERLKTESKINSGPFQTRRIVRGRGVPRRTLGRTLIFLDNLAIIAIPVEEDDAAVLTERLGEAGWPLPRPSHYTRRFLGWRNCNVTIGTAQEICNRFLEQAAVGVIPITEEIGLGALSAFERFGKGRHAAGLNMGDCDFSQTDIAIT